MCPSAFAQSGWVVAPLGHLVYFTWLARVYGRYNIYIYTYTYLYIYIHIWQPTELWKKINVQLRQAAPASDFSIIVFFPIRVQNIPEVIQTFFFFP